MGQPPCVIFEDEHLLVINKPAGINTHAPAPFAPEGIYEWLRNQEPRWANLAIIHRLDKETSGLLVFGKTPVANRSLTRQFTERQVRKTYLLLIEDGTFPRLPTSLRTALVRAGERYLSRPVHAGAEVAETRFALPESEAEKLARLLPSRTRLLQAEPLTGRTHQIRVHASELGCPIRGDRLYGGSDGERVCLHAARLAFTHPASGQPMEFAAPVDFVTGGGAQLREALIDPVNTNAFRLANGSADGLPGVYVDRLGRHLLVQAETSPELSKLAKFGSADSVYYRPLLKQVRRARPEEICPRRIRGTEAPEPFEIRENGLHYELSFRQGYSVGLFLDQRENRRRLLTGYVAPGFFLPPLRDAEVLNTFAYTCGFSVCAAKAGARTTSLDLSRNYLDWGKRNFALNGLDPEKHDFIYGDVFSWLGRLGRKGRAYDVVVLDPPTFSQSKESGVFRAERDYPGLVAAASKVLKPGGVLFCSTNAAEWTPADFLTTIQSALRSSKRTLKKQHFAPQPPDFRVSTREPAYLKTAWCGL